MNNEVDYRKINCLCNSLGQPCCNRRRDDDGTSFDGAVARSVTNRDCRFSVTMKKINKINTNE